MNEQQAWLELMNYFDAGERAIADAKQRLLSSRSLPAVPVALAGALFGAFLVFVLRRG